MRIPGHHPAFILALILATIPTAFARAASPSEICERTAEQVALETGVPVSVLKAISLNETGRKSQGRFTPWPWTVNMEGAGHWFDTRDEALRYVFQEYKRGARSFDIGCFQINYKWHGHQFRSIEEMFEPLANARYAARFLADLHVETGDWSKAAGAYHSRTEQHATRYAARFERFRSKIRNEDAPGSETSTGHADAVAVPEAKYSSIPEIPDIVSAQTRRASRPKRDNQYPLLKGGTSPPPLGAAANASLFAAAVAKREGL